MSLFFGKKGGIYLCLDEYLQNPIKKALKAAGYRIAGVTANWRKCVKACGKKQPDIVLTSNFFTLSTLRERLPDAYLIYVLKFLEGNTEEHIRLALHAGADNVLAEDKDHKVSPPHLLKMVEEAKKELAREGGIYLCVYECLQDPIKKALEEAGYRIAGMTENRVKCIEACGKKKPDVVLISNFFTLLTLREKLPDAYLIYVSTFLEENAEECIRDALDAGADNILAKDKDNRVSLPHLLKMVEKAMKERAPD